jgi:hypothetical protein
MKHHIIFFCIFFKSKVAFPKLKFWESLFILAILFCSCDILRDFPFQVEAWTPGEGEYADPPDADISLLFSHDCDRIKTEQAFSFTEDGKSVKGNFVWEGKRLHFKPASPLEKNKDYAVSLDLGAQNKKGLSLERKFEAFFTTKQAGKKPLVLSVNPVYDGVITPQTREAVRLLFSEKVLLDSCYTYITFNPGAAGSWFLEDEGRTACFAPLEPWRKGIKYKLTVNEKFQDGSGRALGDEFSTVFTASLNGDTERPRLIAAYAEDPEKEKIELIPGEEYGTWESFTKLVLEFSEPVDTQSVKNRLILEPRSGISMESSSGFRESVIFYFSEPPVWGNKFLFKLESGIIDASGNESGEESSFRIKTGGPFSKPPTLIGIRLPMAPGKTGEAEQEALTFMPEDLFGDLPIKTGDDRYKYTDLVKTWIELYFETAPGTELDLFSVMEHFNVESTNGAIKFSPRTIVNKDFTWADPASEWSNLYRLEIRGFLTNTVDSGIVSFVISPGLEDLRGNRQGKAMRISLLK